MLSYILIGNLSIKSTQKVSAEKGLCAESVQLLTLILTEIYNRIKSGKKYKRDATLSSPSNAEGKESSILENLYNDACIAVLARYKTLECFKQNVHIQILYSTFVR